MLPKFYEHNSTSFLPAEPQNSDREPILELAVTQASSNCPETVKKLTNHGRLMAFKKRTVVFLFSNYCF